MHVDTRIRSLQEKIGSERFEIIRPLGSGGMGEVYEARDLLLGERVALKTLQKIDASAILRFKNEFRSLADLSHRNLVTLYELFNRDSLWFFTMELVDGVNFMRYVRDDVKTDPQHSPSLVTAKGTQRDICNRRAHRQHDHRRLSPPEPDRELRVQPETAG